MGQAKNTRGFGIYRCFKKCVVFLRILWIVNLQCNDFEGTEIVSIDLSVHGISKLRDRYVYRFNEGGKYRLRSIPAVFLQKNKCQFCFLKFR